MWRLCDLHSVLLCYSVFENKISIKEQFNVAAKNKNQYELKQPHNKREQTQIDTQ